MNRTGSIVLGTIITAAGLILVAVTANSGHDDPRPLIFGGLIAVAGVVRVMMSFSMDATQRRAHPADPSDPRWLGGAGTAQLAGRACIECGRKITVAVDGVACDVCAAPAHGGCQDLHRTHAHRPEGAGPFR